MTEHAHRGTLPADVFERLRCAEFDRQPEAPVPVANGDGEVDGASHGSSPLVRGSFVQSSVARTSPYSTRNVFSELPGRPAYQGPRGPRRDQGVHLGARFPPRPRTPKPACMQALAGCSPGAPGASPRAGRPVQRRLPSPSCGRFEATGAGGSPSPPAARNRTASMSVDLRRRLAKNGAIRNTKWSCWPGLAVASDFACRTSIGFIGRPGARSSPQQRPR